MGGADGTRGYLYQAMVAILEALEDDTWDNLCVEPNISNQKVDIALSDYARLKTAIQVKSSINNFTKKMIISLMKEIVRDKESAREYRLFFIGNFEKNANNLVKGINGFYEGKETHDVTNILKDFEESFLTSYPFSICIWPIDDRIIMSGLMVSLNKYISKKGYLIQHKALEEISESLITNILLNAIKSERITRNAFDEKVFKHISLNSNLQPVNGFSHHKVGIYDAYRKSFSQEISATTINSWHPYNLLCNKLTQTCKKVIAVISKMRLPERTEEELLRDAEKREAKSNLALKKYISKQESELITAQAPKLHPKALIDDITLDNIVKNADSMFNLKLDKDFFNLGSLQIHEMNSVTKQLFGRDTLIGNDDEKMKYSLIMKLSEQILELNLLGEYANTFENICILPLALHNDSHFSDEDVTVYLKFNGTNASPVSPDNFPVHQELKGKEDLLRNADFVGKLFALPSDDNITEEYTPPLHFHMPRLRFSLDGMGYESSGSYYDELHKYIATPETKARYCFHIKSIHAGEKKWLDHVVLLKAKQYPVILEYTIKSQNSNGSLCGTIKISEEAIAPNQMPTSVR